MPAQASTLPPDALRVLSVIDEAGDEGTTKGDARRAYERGGDFEAFDVAWKLTEPYRATSKGRNAKTSLNAAGRAVLGGEENDADDEGDLA